MKKLKDITKRIATLGLAAALMINSFPATAFAAEIDDPDARSWAELQAQFDSASTDENNPTQITLTDDVTAGEDDSALVIQEGKYVTLNLNDHTIDRGLAGQPVDNNGNVITVLGNLTLTDNSSAHTGTITGGNNAQDPGGGVYVNGGTFTMTGGTISGCNAARGGGVNVYSGTFTMTGGTITGCNAYDSGGGVRVDGSFTMKGGTFTMTGGTITDCNATSYGGRGGGVYVEGGCKFTMDGGTISGCEAVSGGGVYNHDTFNMNGGTITNCSANDSGGGVYIEDRGTFKVSGTPVISGNMKGSTSANNVELCGKTISVNGALTSGAEIHINANKGTPVAQTGSPRTNALTATEAGYFKSDVDSNLLGGSNADGQVVLKDPLPALTGASNLIYNGTEQTPALTFEGVTLTADEDYTVSYKKVAGGTETEISGAPKDAGNYKAVAAGKGRYGGTSEAEFTIDRKEVTVRSGIAADKTYDGTTDAELISTNAVFTGICDGDSLTVNGTGTFADASAGSDKPVTINRSSLTLGGRSSGNYVLAVSGNQTTATGNITKATPTIITNPEAAAITYGNTLLDSNLTNGTAKLGETDVPGSFAWSDNTIAPVVANSNKTEYTVSFTPNDLSNLNTTTCQVKLTVNRADIPADAVTAPEAVTDLTYNGSAKELVTKGTASGGEMWYAVTDSTETTAPVFDGDDPSVQNKKWSTSIPTATDAGTYYVWYMVKGDDNHNDTSPVKLDTPVIIEKKQITVIPKPQTVEAGDDISSDKEEAFLSVSENEALIDGHAISAVSLSTSRNTAAPGDYENVINAAGGKISDSAGNDVTDNYEISYGTGKLTVTKIQVYISGVSANSKPYDKTDTAVLTGTPELKRVKNDAFVSGLQVSDDYSAYFEDVNAGNDKKVYVSGGNLSGADASRYTLVDRTDDKLALKASITPREVGLKWTDTVFTYDGKEHCPAAECEGLLEGDECAVTVTGKAVNANASGESYTATAAGLTNSNYKLPSDNTTGFRIGQKAVTVKADDKVKTEGEADPDFTASVSGMIEGDSLSYTLSRAEGEAPGTYEITVSGESSQGNYAVSFENGVFTIEKKENSGNNGNPDISPAERKIKEETISTSIIPEGTGTVEIKTVTEETGDEGYEVGKVDIPMETVVSLLTEEELRQVKEGETLTVTLEVKEIVNNSEEDKDKAKKKVEDFISGIKEAADNGTGTVVEAGKGIFLSITLYKQIGDAERTEAHPGEGQKVSFTVQVPEEMKTVSENVVRTYLLIHILDDGSTEIAAKSCDTEFPVEAESFSAWYLTYVDEVKSGTDSHGGNVEPGSNDNPGGNGNDPGTGDNPGGNGSGDKKPWSKDETPSQNSAPGNDNSVSGNESSAPVITVSDNKPFMYSEEVKGEFRISYCHEIPFYGKAKADIKLFGEQGITVSVNGKSYKAAKVKINKKKQLITITGLDGADKDLIKKVKKATKGANGLSFKVNPYYVKNTDKVTIKTKKDGKVSSVKVEINGKDYKTKKDEWKYDEALKKVTFTGKNLTGVFLC